MQHLPVHWHEGMFLRPQHFQAAERYWNGLLETGEHWDHEYNYGIRAIEFSAEAIANFQFQLSQCQARLQDGTVVILAPGREPDRLNLKPSLGAGSSKPLDLRAALDRGSTVRIFLAVPKLRLGSVNVAADGEADKHRFQTEMRAIPDDGVGGQDQEIQVRTLNVQLLLSTQELSGYELLPIAQIQRSGDEGATPQLDVSYIPPVLATDAWPQLGRDIVRAIYDIVGDRIEGHTQQIVNRRITIGSPEPKDMELAWRLSVLNAAYTMLGVLAFARGIHPLQAYTELCRLVGQLSIFAKARRPPEIPRYDHDDLGGIFNYIKQQIELLLGDTEEYQYEMRYFEGEGLGMQVRLDRKWFGGNWDWFIGAFRDTLTDAECRALLLQGLEWKLGSAEKVDQLFRERGKGLDLFPLNQVPREIPGLQECSFFRVGRQNSAWEDVVRSGTLAMRLKAALIVNKDQLNGKREIIISAGGRVVNLQFAIFAVPKQS